MRLPGTDIAARRRAAELLGDFLRDRISGGQLEESWPSSRFDAALEGIAGVIFPYVRGGRLSEEYDQADREDLARILDRCRLFLLSDFPYVRGDVGARGFLKMALTWAVCLLAALIALMVSVYRMTAALVLMFPAAVLLALRVRMSRSRWRLDSLVSGDLRYWPFDLEEDLSAVEAQTREPPVPGVSDAGSAGPEGETS